MKCFNCTNDALYLITHPAVSDVAYCHLCLPSHLKTQADRGDFTIPAPVVEEAPVKKSKKAAPVETPVEEAIETPLEAPAEPEAATE